MGIFQHKQDARKKTPIDEASEDVQQLFDENFREELRERGRLYFEKVINENAALFKQDLDATIAQVNTELEVHIIRQVDAQLVEHSKTMKTAQESALQSMNRSAKTIDQDSATFKQQLDESINIVKNELKEHVVAQIDGHVDGYVTASKEAQATALQSMARSAQTVQEQYQQLSATVEKNIAHQGDELAKTYESSKSQLASIQATQEKAAAALNQSAQAVMEQYQQLNTTLAKNVADQEAIMIGLFQDNMSRIVEHYLLDALGEAYDLKSQLPAIIKQLEANKQAIVEDMKL